MKILIIGSKGFIGSCFQRYMLEKKHNVWGCDVEVDYISKNYFLLDASNSDYQSVFAQTQFDICINCSGAASVADSIQNPWRDFELNTRNVFLLLNAIRKHNPNCRFIQISSAAVYGNPQNLPVHEESQISPLSPYGYHKMLSENICREFFELYNIKIAIVRIFSAYGPGLKKQIFWDLNKKFSSSDEILIDGTGNESRDFIFIDDINQCIDLIIQKSEFEMDIYNVANGIEVRISEAVKVFSELFYKTYKINFSNQNRQGDPINWLADISRLKKIGYQAKIDLKIGLVKYKEWLDENGF